MFPAGHNYETIVKGFQKGEAKPRRLTTIFIIINKYLYVLVHVQDNILFQTTRPTAVAVPQPIHRI